MTISVFNVYKKEKRKKEKRKKKKKSLMRRLEIEEDGLMTNTGDSVEYLFILRYTLPHNN